MTAAVLTFSGVLFAGGSSPHAYAPATDPHAPGVTPSGGAGRDDARGGGKAGGGKAKGGGVAGPASESARRRAETTASGPSRHTDTQAMDYFAWRWGPDGAVKRITDIRTVGGYLRIYTDLPDTAHDSHTAITLCRHGLEYLTKRLGRANPVVFVQARFGENGNPVLANVLGHGDRTCRVTYPEPRH
jgi:hypothetical protein